MREFIGLFRGKRKDNGEWIEGAYMPHYYSFRYGKVSAISTNNDELCKTYRYPVDPDTIGECTGLKDKNGKLIFEGDILSSSWGYKGEVELDTIMYAKLECLFNEDCEIIGNIHDNPELLKGGGGE